MVRIELLGTSFRVDSDKSEAYLQRVVELYSQRVAQIDASMRNRDPLKKAILAGLLVTDEYLQQQEKVKEPPDADQVDEVEQITSRLIREIDATL